MRHSAATSTASPAPSVQSGPDSGATTSSGRVAKELSTSGPIVVPKVLRPKKLPVKRTSHKAADFGLGGSGQTLISKPVEDTPSTLVQPEKTPIQMEPMVEETPSSKLEEAGEEKTAAASTDLQSAN
ncbi:hypothetical protein PVAP13_5KG278600 [Panicum virgatum]|uniref:Uncharacterized protein n=1 Tax=Panicum virgatum TaxID=38727 RepID=A0A8T0SES4_PANVG|nr:hypothetical protein PVAP13_5KG278600 [Panicum virgatum]